MNGDPAPVRFTDLEFEVDGIKFMWSGEAWVDANEHIYQIDMEWLGEGPGSIIFDVPAHHAVVTTFKDTVIRTCAETLSTKYAEEIKASVDEWSVEIAERQWEAAE